ncbi:antibiotic biosynthesis monooxygenase [Methylobacterium sp. J-043]|uniref:putative quinol monooxygenase n=2 Tax=Methylobacteriaceae TaxID=119045 RepID=UPI001AE20D89|nr:MULTISPECIES: putative quinol monooxygenase [Methylorubrum]MCJ2032102.1 antibiotic biosynthesis monooxygenase [Methylobacterium sp. J-043]MCP1535576.1 quinol monooxygenase YgiN [Methylorubrum extorquens]MCP1551554.1 quinol monooxygenase YgiN [Methylorubrum zatmanii]MCP1556491.1 quinol monooxygenase YgiN [Methylorubrum extorquens]MCP1581848.1 quinol monooxygenase YgiN [Methylorubrum extorquens]
MTNTLDAAIRSAALAGTADPPSRSVPGRGGGGAASAKDAAPTPIEFYASISVKPEAMDGFLAVMRANARASREEAGTVSFDAYRRADCGNELLLMERWANEAAVEAHGQTPHLQAVVDRIESDLNGAPQELHLVRLSPMAPEKPITDPAATRNVAVTLHVKPEKREAFQQALLDVVEPFNAIWAESLARPLGEGRRLLSDAAPS